jgi:hypothetical protein
MPLSGLMSKTVRTGSIAELGYAAEFGIEVVRSEIEIGSSSVEYEDTYDLPKLLKGI